MDEVINEIHSAGGIAVLAHPSKFDNFDEIDKYIEMGLDGVEVWHPLASDEDVERLAAICKRKSCCLRAAPIFTESTVIRPLPSAHAQHLRTSR